MSSPAREPIGVIGTGYVGLVTAAGFAEVGNEVWCIDIDADKVERLRRGEIPIYEPGLAELVEKHRGRLHFSTDIADALEHARLLFVSVGTPPTYSGDADLSAVHAVVDAMPPSDRHALVMKSTVPVGTGESIKRIFAERGKEGFRYVSCPEFLKEGSAVSDFLEPDRVVVGDDGDWAGDAVVELYAPLDAPLVRTDIASAEMIKLAANAFLATKISFINEIANVCEVTGANVTEVAKGIGLDDRIGPKFLQAGVGFGGSCLAGDETVLVRHHGRTELLSFERLWARLEAEEGEVAPGVIEPAGVEVLSWLPGSDAPRFMPVSHATRRTHQDEILEVRTKMGRRVRVTPDHPFVVGDGGSDDVEIKSAETLTDGDWLPLARGRDDTTAAPGLRAIPAAVGAAGVGAPSVVGRRRVVGLSVADGRPSFDEHEGNRITRSFRLDRTGDEQRLPDAIWEQAPERTWALLSGLFAGDRSWSLVNGGQGAIIESRAMSREPADAALRLLGDLGIVASQRVARTATSTADTHRLRVAGADQVERAIALVPERDRPGVYAAIERERERTGPTGYRTFGDGPAWVRVTDVRRAPYAGVVYSLEVPGVDTFVTTGGLTVHNCFPKDVSALKQLAGNSGYHFQLLNSVIEVNELQKRRVIGKLEKHLGTLVGKRVALLGLAFKPNTDDMREATSLVLSARLQAAGAHVSAYDPIAEEEARRLMPGLDFADDALGCVHGADAVVLVTEWDEFKQLDLARVADAMAGTVLIDGRNALDPEAVRAAGLLYEGIGRG